MCGIAGLIRLNSAISEKDISEVERGASLLVHRGPDQQGLFIDNNAVIANTRLSILDHSSNASLPMYFPAHDLILAYNGEVSNFQELTKRYSLREKYEFFSTSDTEVLAYLYLELGIDFLECLSGMFALSLYDRKQNVFYLIRDFYGINPVFYWQTKDNIYFSSELKFFHGLSDFSPAVDGQAIFDYFSLAYIPGERTPYQQIKELEAGCLLKLDFRSKKVQKKKYYQLRYEPNFSLSESEAADNVHELFRDSVRRNLISDAPIGLTLSGGIDTSSMLAMAKELGVAKGMRTFSIKMGQASFDESKYQRIMAEFAGSVHHEISVSEEKTRNALHTHMAFLDEPSGNGAAIPSYILAQEAKEYVSVLLSGEGGDEIFNAYETHGAYKARKLYRKICPRFLRLLLQDIAHRLPTNYDKLSFDFVAKRFTTGSELDTAQAHLYWRHAFTNEDKKVLFNQAENYYPTDQLFADHFSSMPFSDDLDKISMLDIMFYFVGDLMVKNDRMFMAHSIETRFPLMDKVLIDYVRTIPASMRMKGFKRRYLQKLSMRNSLPKQILARSNFGLETPYSDWFMGKFRDVGNDYFKESVRDIPFIDFSKVNVLWCEHLAKKRDHGRGLWCLLQYIVWFEMFVDKRNFTSYLSTKNIRFKRIDLRQNQNMVRGADRSQQWV